MSWHGSKTWNSYHYKKLNDVLLLDLFRNEIINKWNYMISVSFLRNIREIVLDKTGIDPRYDASFCSSSDIYFSSGDRCCSLGGIFWRLFFDLLTINERRTVTFFGPDREPQLPELLCFEYLTSYGPWPWEFGNSVLEIDWLVGNSVLEFLKSDTDRETSKGRHREKSKLMTMK